MNLFNKLEIYLDYNNEYSINKTLGVLLSEFNRAKNRNNKQEILNYVKQMKEKFNGFQDSMKDYGKSDNYFQIKFNKKFNSLIDYLNKNL